MSASLTPAPAPASSGETMPERFCDIVMKGGITSGVVYPLAAVTLARRFRFKNIGGTSAGAIAAAAAAAAELARERGGFERLAALPEFLCGSSPDRTGSNLLGFFQPQPRTRRLFRICLALLESKPAGIARALREYAWAAIAGALPGVAFGGLAWTHTAGWFLGLCLVLASIALLAGVALLVLAAGSRDLTRALPANGYGLCSGMTAAFANVTAASGEPRASQPLTYWLDKYLNSFVGRDVWDRPLTFGELWEPDTYQPGSGRVVPAVDRFLNLEMMTTCLTHGRPYRLPFRDDEDLHENDQFWFSVEEFRRLFPENVVAWMIAHGRPSSSDERVREGNEALRARGFLPLPAPADLPVVVAVRMSLSFPLLLSAVPLHGRDWSRDPSGATLEPCWFSDGGACSNFPIHFFDAPLPRWPTLTLNLVSRPRGTPAERLRGPEMVQSNSEGIHERWNRFEVDEFHDAATQSIVTRPKSGARKLVGFLGAIITTMQNWSDQTQSRLPGYRDRIAHVGLTPEEGGLNLAMPEDLIRELTERGRQVGEEFIARFASPPAHSEMHWENHRWLRLRSCLASTEILLGRLEAAVAAPQPGDISYSDLLDIYTPDMIPPGYPWASRTQYELAQHALQELRTLAQAIGSTGASLAKGAPRPRPELRPRAQV